MVTLKNLIPNGSFEKTEIIDNNVYVSNWSTITPFDNAIRISTNNNVGAILDSKECYHGQYSVLCKDETIITCNSFKELLNGDHQYVILFRVNGYCYPFTYKFLDSNNNELYSIQNNKQDYIWDDIVYYSFKSNDVNNASKLEIGIKTTSEFRLDCVMLCDLTEAFGDNIPNNNEIGNIISNYFEDEYTINYKTDIAITYTDDFAYDEHLDCWYVLKNDFKLDLNLFSAFNSCAIGNLKYDTKYLSINLNGQEINNPTYTNLNINSDIGSLTYVNDTNLIIDNTLTITFQNQFNNVSVHTINFKYYPGLFKLTSNLENNPESINVQQLYSYNINGTTSIPTNLFVSLKAIINKTAEFEFLINDDGSFNRDIFLIDGSNEIELVATDFLGNEIKQTKNVLVDILTHPVQQSNMLTNFIGTDGDNIELHLNNAILEYENKFAGINKGVKIDKNDTNHYFSISGPNSELYRLDKQTALTILGDIIPKPIHVDFKAIEKIYDGTSDMSNEVNKLLTNKSYKFLDIQNYEKDYITTGFVENIGEIKKAFLVPYTKNDTIEDTYTIDEPNVDLSTFKISIDGKVGYYNDEINQIDFEQIVKKVTKEEGRNIIESGYPKGLYFYESAYVKSKQPNIDYIIRDNEIISGIGISNALIKLEFSKDDIIPGEITYTLTTNVDLDGFWSINIDKELLEDNNYIFVTQYEIGKDASDTIVQEIHEIGDIPQSESPVVFPITRDDKLISGTGIPGSEIYIFINDAISTETTLVDANGNWSYSFTNKIANRNDTFRIYQIEPFKEDSELIIIGVGEKDKSANPGINCVHESNEYISGIGISGSTIEIVFDITSNEPTPTPLEDEENEINNIVTTIVDESGNWNVKIPEDIKLTLNQKINISQTQIDFDKSNDVTINVCPGITSETPVINPIINHPVTLSGTGVAGSIITIYYKDELLTKDVLVQSDGTWSYEVGDNILEDGFVISATQKDISKYITSEIRVTTNEMSLGPTINPIFEGDNTISGKSKSNSYVFVKFSDGTEIKRKTNNNGTFNVNVPNNIDLIANELVEVTLLEETESESPISTIGITPSYRKRSDIPLVNTISHHDTTISGKGVPNAKIEIFYQDKSIRSGINVDSSGEWLYNVPKNIVLEEQEIVTIIQREPNKIKSKNVLVTIRNGFVSDAPSIDGVIEGDTKISGTGVANSKIFINVNDQFELETIVGSNNIWNVNIPDDKYIEGDVLITVNQLEDGKKISMNAITETQRLPQLNTFTINSFNIDSNIITGTGINGSKVDLYILDDINDRKPNENYFPLKDGNYNVTKNSINNVNGLKYYTTKTLENAFISQRCLFDDDYEGLWCVHQETESVSNNRYFTFKANKNGKLKIWAKSTINGVSTVTVYCNNKKVKSYDFIGNDTLNDVVRIGVNAGTIKINSDGPINYYRLDFIEDGLDPEHYTWDFNDAPFVNIYSEPVATTNVSNNTWTLSNINTIQIEEETPIKFIQSQNKYKSNEIDLSEVQITNQSRIPQINLPYLGDELILGKGIANSTIYVSINNGNIIETFVESNGTWEIGCEPLEMVNITIQQIEENIDPSPIITITPILKDKSKAPSINSVIATTNEITGYIDSSIEYEDLYIIIQNNDTFHVDINEDGKTWNVPISLNRINLEAGLFIDVIGLEKNKEITNYSRVIVKEGYASEIPQINPIMEFDKQITGYGLASSEINLKVHDVDYKTIVDNNNEWAFKLPEDVTLNANDTITINQLVQGFELSSDVTTYVRENAYSDQVLVNSIFINQNSISGTGKANSQIIIEYNDIKLETNTNNSGEWNISLTQYPQEYDEIKIYQIEQYKDISLPITLYANRNKQLESIILNPFSISNDSIIGKGYPNATITMLINDNQFSINANQDGNFEFTINEQLQESDNLEFYQLLDGFKQSVSIKTKPSEPLRSRIPTIDLILEEDIIISGTGIPDSQIDITIDTTTYGTSVNEDGIWSITISPLKLNQYVIVNQTEKYKLASEMIYFAIAYKDNQFVAINSTDDEVETKNFDTREEAEQWLKDNDKLKWNITLELDNEKNQLIIHFNNASSYVVGDRVYITYSYEDLSIDSLQPPRVNFIESDEGKVWVNYQSNSDVKMLSKNVTNGYKPVIINKLKLEGEIIKIEEIGGEQIEYNYSDSYTLAGYTLLGKIIKRTIIPHINLIEKIYDGSTYCKFNVSNNYYNGFDNVIQNDDIYLDNKYEVIMKNESPLSVNVGTTVFEFEDCNVGQNKVVNIKHLILEGKDSNNYKFISNDNKSNVNYDSVSTIIEGIDTPLCNILQRHITIKILELRFIRSTRKYEVVYQFVNDVKRDNLTIVFNSGTKNDFEVKDEHGNEIISTYFNYTNTKNYDPYNYQFEQPSEMKFNQQTQQYDMVKEEEIYLTNTSYNEDYQTSLNYWTNKGRIARQDTNRMDITIERNINDQANATFSLEDQYFESYDKQFKLHNNDKVYISNITLNPNNPKTKNYILDNTTYEIEIKII